ncbi:DUF3397 family protein [Brochothrix campestris]|uniref:DUF3397 family protein n=1 Tax=Brochothrix campestris TaxID=2757 RepID=UPI0038CF3F8F
MTVGLIVLPIILFVVLKIFIKSARVKAFLSYVLIVSLLVACFCLFDAKDNEQLFLYCLLFYLVVGVVYILVFNAVKKELYVKKVLKGYVKILLILLPLTYSSAIVLMFFS